MISMDAWKLGFILLLPLTACSQDLGGETFVKTIGKQPDVTQICANETHTLTLIVCTIRTQRRENCRLLYQHGHDFVHGCDSRFTLMKENQTVFLHLNDLTAEDSGNYTCQCTYAEGTYVLHFYVTVGEVGGSTEISVSIYLVGAVTVIITGVILGFTCRMKCHSCSRSAASGPSMHETHGSLDEAVTYVLYNMITSVYHQAETKID